MLQEAKNNNKKYADSDISEKKEKQKKILCMSIDSIMLFG